jgi:predicted DNA-binding transcriptional regulator YafY
VLAVGEPPAVLRVDRGGGDAHDDLVVVNALEVDLRTVRRYVTMLQDLGIPVEAERGSHGGYRLRPGFRLPPLVFSDDEALALTLGLLSARRLGLMTNAATIEGALAKLDRALPPDVRARVSAVQETLTIDLARGQAVPATTTVMALAAAVADYVFEHRSDGPGPS